jgi:hypothetical protein
MSYTYAILEVSEVTYEEVTRKLREAGYGQAFHAEDEYVTVIDMHGLALALAKAKSDRQTPSIKCNGCGVWLVLKLRPSKPDPSWYAEPHYCFAAPKASES